MRLAQKSPDMNSAKQSNSSVRRDRRSRSKSNNNIKNANKVPLVRRDQPVSRNRSRSRGKPTRDEKSKVSKRRSRSNSRTKLNHQRRKTLLPERNPDLYQ